MSEESVKQRVKRKTRLGRVVSDGMDKTVVVETVRRVPHPAFNKIVKQVKKFFAHDEGNEAKEGDIVRIMETRPLSKKKRWRVVEVQARGEESKKPATAAKTEEAAAPAPTATTEKD